MFYKKVINIFKFKFYKLSYYQIETYERGREIEKDILEEFKV